MCSAKFTLMFVNVKVGWVCINAMEEGNVNMLNLNKRLMNITLVLIVSMLKINVFMALLGQIYDWPSVEYKENSKKKNLQFVTTFHLLNRGGRSLIVNAWKGFLIFF
jgi:hypothetical protein